MIHWRHPRIFERLRCFGLSLFTLGLALRNMDNPPAAIAAIIVTALLLVRLKIELDIQQDEDESAFERKLHRIEQINSLVIVPAVFGLIAMVRRMDVA